MINLTHNEDSAVDIGAVWTGPDEIELHFRFNKDHTSDLEIRLVLTADELEVLKDYLNVKLIQQPIYVKQ
tara:strand:- start:1249 stop:1458 length:210 start_codon:yes stop_codon:yes gene_type:complete